MAIIRGTTVIIIAGIISVVIAVEAVVTEWIPVEVRRPPVKSHPEEGAVIIGIVAVGIGTVVIVIIINIGVVISCLLYSDSFPCVPLVDGGATGNEEN